MSSLTNQASSSDPSSTSMTTTSTTTTTTTATTVPSAKKKFGKNLNKLTKPPAPPTAAESSKGNAASRNGLLLLSTNKRGSGSGPSKNGLLASNKPSVVAPLPSLGLQYESSTSTHDVLLGAVVGAAASRVEEKPDAWGRAAAASNNSVPANNQKSSTSGVADGKEVPKEQKESTKDTTPPSVDRSNDYTLSDADTYAGKDQQQQQQQQVVASSNWDEYGGRDSTSGANRRLVDIDNDPRNQRHSSSSNNNNSIDSQQAYMAKLARERADERRQEEASRAREQKEKAAQRLQALESKMGQNGSNQRRSDVVLEPLGGSSASSSDNNGAVPSSRPIQKRSLYDPNRTFSSLVGGAGTDGKHKQQQSSNGGGTSVGSREEQPRGDVSPGPGSTPGGGAYSGPMIQLNSYEDRDRGEAPRAAAPRMLFDPKSGSMVAVSSRDDSKRTNTKTAKRSRNKVKDPADDGNKKAPANVKNASRSKPIRTKEFARDKKKEKSKLAGKSSINSERKLPRTRGVLYARDDKGNCYCADGCDGDLGYGSHSVEGGRVRNPESYAEFVEQQQQLYKEQVPPSDGGRARSMSADGYNNYSQHAPNNPYLAIDENAGMGIHAGYAANERHEEHHTPMQLDWLKPNEKIELVTGVDDSPTLQATAREWAPSQAALTAAAQAAVMPSLGSHEDDDNSNAGVPATSLEPRENPVNSNILLGANSEDEEDEDDDDSPHFMGLGFDPTKDMDAVIQSPSAKGHPDASSQLEGMNFGSLALEPPLCGVSANNHNNIFAFGSSAAWGAGGGSDGWGAPVLGSSSGGSIAGSRLFGDVLSATNGGNAALGEDQDDDAFLSLTSGIPGFLTGGGDDDGNGED